MVALIEKKKVFCLIEDKLLLRYLLNASMMLKM